ncbi:hypothetical protein TK06_03900 [Pseudomonas fluorescens]|uniref:Uncharacterized protein n=1 Tax=Pseudomonas fluorescens TaxID=294 RepID=A0A159ZSC1_PSEFL|nr:hypothetical protein TK06_03900 [Pseudomonas fluorescens]
MTILVMFQTVIDILVVGFIDRFAQRAAPSPVGFDPMTYCKSWILHIGQQVVCSQHIQINHVIATE